MSAGGSIRFALAGDVMIGRGVDQIMHRPGDPRLYEPAVRTAERYLDLAEAASGPISRPVGPAYVWGDSLLRLEQLGAEIRIVNLETAVTAQGSPWPHKGIHYRVHPENADCLAAGGIDAVTLANNHILDWSEPGLLETLETLDEMAIRCTGAGRDLAEAWAPAIIPFEGSCRVVMLGVGVPSSGIDLAWAARHERPGVALLASLSHASVLQIAEAFGERTQGDVRVVSIHWGSNWGYRVSSNHRRFARALIDEVDIDVVHGHSSHHPLGLEVYRDRLILYGCGDLLTDYEGIGGHERYRPELGAWYVVDADPMTGAIHGLRFVPTKVERFRLNTPNREEVGWLANLIQEETRSPGVQVRAVQDHLLVEW